MRKWLITFHDGRTRRSHCPLHTVSYLGPSTNAEKAAAATFDQAFSSQTIVADTYYTPISAMNDMAEPMNRHGEKENYAAWVASVTSSAIVSTFKRWIRFGEETPEAKATSYVVFAAKSTKDLLKHSLEDRKFFPRTIRSRNVFVQVAPWWKTECGEQEARSWAAEMLAIMNAP